jgi:xanthine phosphoribosyltransferase
MLAICALLFHLLKIIKVAMKSLVEILKKNAIYLGNGIIKVDSILNHQVNPVLLMEIGKEFVSLLGKKNIHGVTKVVTAEASGIAPAFCVAFALKVPLIYARKGSPITMQSDRISVEVKSSTKKQTTTLFLSREFLGVNDKVIIVDDFLGTGGALEALSSLVSQTGAEILCACFVIEKVYERARDKLIHIEYPIYNLTEAQIEEEALSFSCNVNSQE